MSKKIKEPALYGYSYLKDIKYYFKKIPYLFITAYMWFMSFLLIYGDIIIILAIILFIIGCIPVIINIKRLKEYISDYGLIQKVRQEEYDRSMDCLKNNDYLQMLAKKDRRAKRLLKARMQGKPEHYAKRPKYKVGRAYYEEIERTPEELSYEHYAEYDEKNGSPVQNLNYINTSSRFADESEIHLILSCLQNDKGRITMDEKIKEPALYGYLYLKDIKDYFNKIPYLFFTAYMWFMCSLFIYGDIIILAIVPFIIGCIPVIINIKRLKEYISDYGLQKARQEEYDRSMDRLKNNDYLQKLAKKDRRAKRLLKARMQGKPEHYAKRPKYKVSRAYYEEIERTPEELS